MFPPGASLLSCKSQDTPYGLRYSPITTASVPWNTLIKGITPQGRLIQRVKVVTSSLGRRVGPRGGTTPGRLPSFPYGLGVVWVIKGHQGGAPRRVESAALVPWWLLLVTFGRLSGIAVVDTESPRAASAFDKCPYDPPFSC